MEYQLRNLSKEFWREVKMLAVKHGITIRRLIITVLELAIKKDAIQTENNQPEHWKPILSASELEASTYGRIRNTKTQKICKLSLFEHGYLMIGGKFVHALIAETFLGPKPNSKYVVDHEDNDKLNNRVNNLRHITAIDNNAYGWLAKHDVNI